MSDTSATLKIDGMSCASCTGRVEKVLLSVPGVQSANVNLANGTAYVTGAGADVATRASQAVTQAGYPAHLRQTGEGAEEPNTLYRGVIFAALLSLPVFILEMGSHLSPAFHHWVHTTLGAQVSRLIQFVLTSAVLFWPGRGFFTKGLRSLIGRAPDMNALVALGAGAAFLYSSLVTFAPSALPDGARHVYFESAVLIVTLILLGRALEARAKSRTGAAIAALAKLQPSHARILKDGQAQDIALSNIVQGDHIQIRPGERIAVDGTVLDGASYVDEAMLTGEPLPVHKTQGSAVTGGTLNGSGALVVQAEAVGADSALAQIIAMVERAQGAKLPVQDLVNKITAIFVPIVLLIAALTFAVWMIFGPSPALSHALVAGVCVLIIACPCAMGLATPSAIMVGTGRAAELGVLFRQGSALQTLTEARVVVFDKTGTITRGQPELTDLVRAPDRTEEAALKLIAALEAKSEHPIAKAILSAAEKKSIKLPPASDVQARAGFGIIGQVEGQKIALGTQALMESEGVDTDALSQHVQEWASQGKTALYAASNGVLIAVLAVGDSVKDDAADAIARLKAKGLSVAMLSGDSEVAARAIASTVGIDEVIGGVLPAGKVEALQQLRARHGAVAFVGDGINDAPALAEAEIGIAIGTGTDVAIEAADVVLMSGQLAGVPRAIELSQRTMRTIHQNLFWAFAYNVLLIPVAAGLLYPALGVLLSPGLAAGAMALSSVFVLTNALRLRYALGAEGDA